MAKITVEIDTDVGTARVLNADQSATVTTPPLLPNDFAGSPPEFGGIVSADWWMIGKTGAKAGALYSHWTQYNQIASMMGRVTEFEVVCAPEPGNAAQMNPSNFNSCVYNAWEPRVGWVDKAPPQQGNLTDAEIRQQWADYYANFKAKHQR